MKKDFFNKIVKKMGTKGGKILFKNDIFELIDPEKKQQNINKLNKFIYELKSRDIIVSIKAGVYIVPEKEDKDLNKIDLIEKYYFKLLKKYITYYLGSDYYISGIKSLEVHNKNYAVVNKIYIVNRSLNKKIKFGDYEIVFKTISGKDNGKKINLFNKFKNFVVKKQIEGQEFKFSNIELALVESVVISDSEQFLDLNLISKTLKKYSKFFNKEIFYEIGKYKYIMAFNRLKELAKNIDKSLYEIFLDIIKKNGGLFIGEGLRNL